MEKYVLEIDGFGIYVAKNQLLTGVKTTTNKAKAMVFDRDCSNQKAEYYQLLLAKAMNNDKVSVEAVPA